MEEKDRTAGGGQRTGVTNALPEQERVMPSRGQMALTAGRTASPTSATIHFGECSQNHQGCREPVLSNPPRQGLFWGSAGDPPQALAGEKQKQ